MMIYLYISNIYVENDNLIVLYETSSTYANLLLEKYLSDIGIIDKNKITNRDRSYLKMSYPTKKSKRLRLRLNQWHVFPIEYFASVENYRVLTDEEAGATVLRAEIAFRKVPDKKPKPIGSNCKLGVVGAYLDEIDGAEIYGNKDLNLIFNAAKLVVANKEKALKVLVKKNALKIVKDHVKKHGVKKVIELINRDDAEELKAITFDAAEEKAIQETLRYEEYLSRIREHYSCSNINEVVLNKKQDCTIMHVLNCGHANWNELETEDFTIIYDLGASNSLTQNEIKAELVKKRIGPLSRGGNSIVISHWDTDHYQSVFHFDESSFDKFSYVFLPNPVKKKEKQHTVLKAVAKFYTEYFKSGLAMDKKLYMLNQSKRKTRHISVTQSTTKISANIVLHTGNLSADSNKSGLILQVINDDCHGHFSGDHTWRQISDALIFFPAIDNSNQLITVTPHHGGNAGSLSYLKELEKNYKVKLVTSCDEVGNSYGHPMDKFISLVNKLNLKHSRTDLNPCSIALGQPITCAINHAKAMSCCPERLL